MPVFKSGTGLAPAWCELEYFEIVDLQSGETHTFERMGRKEKLIVGQGAAGSKSPARRPTRRRA